ncbi:hypothetical protein NESM_000421200 [Novymonas esmeraldas]|uniref:SMP-LTD domain-containing protein n=1 Tax=Novymonas esmeraldas TaxID=1808958 RepID=A0AAW0EMT5_9TRYP
MLHWDWPQTWSVHDRETIRTALETSIRAAMAKGESKRVRGLVHVDLPELGSTPPQVMLTAISELSLEHTAFMVRVRYDGELRLKLRGLQVNVDTVGTNSTLSSDTNFAMPFYCPLELTLSDFHVDGVASIAIIQDIADVATTTTATTSGDEATAASLLRPESAMGLTGTSRSTDVASLSSLNRAPRGGLPWGPSAAPSSSGRSPRPGGYPSSGYGVLLGAGGRRAMRPPEAAMPGGHASGAATSTSVLPQGYAAGAADASVAAGGISVHNSSGGGGGGGGTRGSAGPSAATGQPRHSLIDLASKRAVVRQRRVKVQLFGDPIKRYRVESNLVAVPGAGKKVEEHIQDILKPVIERLMTEGITVELAP